MPSLSLTMKKDKDNGMMYFVSRVNSPAAESISYDYKITEKEKRGLNKLIRETLSDVIRRGGAADFITMHVWVEELKKKKDPSFVRLISSLSLEKVYHFLGERVKAIFPGRDVFVERRYLRLGSNARPVEKLFQCIAFDGASEFVATARAQFKFGNANVAAPATIPVNLTSNRFAVLANGAAAGPSSSSGPLASVPQRQGAEGSATGAGNSSGAAPSSNTAGNSAATVGTAVAAGTAGTTGTAGTAGTVGTSSSTAFAPVRAAGTTSFASAAPTESVGRVANSGPASGTGVTRSYLQAVLSRQNRRSEKEPMFPQLKAFAFPSPPPQVFNAPPEVNTSLERAVASMEAESVAPPTADRNQQPAEHTQQFAEGMEIEPPVGVAQSLQSLAIPNPLVDFASLEIETSRRPMQNDDDVNGDEKYVHATDALNLGGLVSPVQPMSPVLPERERTQILSPNCNASDSQNQSALDLFFGSTMEANVVPEVTPTVTQPVATNGVETRAMKKNASLLPAPSHSLLH
jgi:hypothetical protein